MMRQYKEATFICIDYDDMIHIFNVKYAEIKEYMNKSIAFGKENGRTTKKRNGYC